MPETTFGKTIKSRRTRLGLSQAKLGELVGRSPSTIRSWEKDSTSPADQEVLTALAAVLGIDEALLYEKAGQALPEVESSPTIEQALASLRPEPADDEHDEIGFDDELPTFDSGDGAPEVDSAPAAPKHVRPDNEPTQVGYLGPPPSYKVTAASPQVHEPSYMEDSSQRQLYRVRNLATIVVLAALVLMFLWALREGSGAIGTWWDEFFGNLRL
jgi:transcriptional regulator with XRE-family HTH domain